MLILACDTSGSACSVCFYKDGKVLGESFLSVGLTHSQTFMPLLEDLRKNIGVQFDEIDIFACSVGPGSFTGIRIGVSAVKTMAMVKKRPALPVSSLQALAYPFDGTENQLIVSVMDARNRRVYSGAFLEGREVVAQKAQTVEELWKELSDFNRCEDRKIANQENRNIKIRFCGDAAFLYAKEAEEQGFHLVPTDKTSLDIRASSVAALAFEIAKDQDPNDLYTRFSPASLTPAYLVKTSAERLREQQV